MCRDSTVYDPQEVKQFLMEAKLPDPRPLIHVCDRFDFVDEMTAYLFSNNLMKYIEVYVQKVSPQKTPQVVGKLLDLEASEDFIRALLNSVGQLCPAAELVEQVTLRVLNYYATISAMAAHTVLNFDATVLLFGRVMNSSNLSKCDAIAQTIHFLPCLVIL